MGSLIIVAGARPNFMKVAPILRALRARRAPWTPLLVHTGQHYDHEMSGVFFEQLGIPQPDVHLQVGSSTHSTQTARIMIAFEEYLLGLAERPAGVVVVGDVNSTLACALVATKQRLRVAHVEAGLRSFDRGMPEEINRVATDVVSDLLLVSEPAGLVNLAAEGIPEERIRYCGNVMIDTLCDQLAAARAIGMPERLGVVPRGYAVVTLHRPANVDDGERLRELLALVTRLAERVPVIFPVHPRTDARIRGLGASLDLGLRCVEPLGYREFIGLLDSAKLVVTDSGGIQEESTYLGIPCITLRSSTERPVTITSGTNVLAGDNLDVAWREVERALANPAVTSKPIDGWDGHAADRVADAIIETWGR